MRRNVIAATAAVMVAAVVTGTCTAAFAARQAAFTGSGFDTCSAPSITSLQAWLASPYRAIGIYVGGLNRACSNPQLTSSWVSGARGLGWNLLPLYVGRQAPCVSGSNLATIDPANAAGQGRAAAADAAQRAAAISIGTGSPIYFDMEGYSTRNPSCSQTVQQFVSGWVAGLHAAGYVAGVYGSAASTIRDLQALATTSSSPDDVWIANWNNVHGVFGDPYVSDEDRTNHQRLHQYSGGHHETYGGVTINIDSNSVDAAVAGPGSVRPVEPTGTSAAGTAVSLDGQARARWAAGTFEQDASVTLTPALPSPPVHGFGRQGYGTELAVANVADASPVASFVAPVTLTIAPQPGKLAPVYSADDISWKPLPQLVAGDLAPGSKAGYARAANGTVTILTTVAGHFALVTDPHRPATPRDIRTVLDHGTLTIRWAGSSDGSGTVASYTLTLANKPLLALPAASRRADVARFHHDGRSIFHVVATDSAGNVSSGSRPVVVAPTPRPKNLPKAIPAWAWRLVHWQAGGQHGARPVAPKIVPRWYWHWSHWRLAPFHLVRGQVLHSCIL